jgi:hypothetical protein
VREKIARLANKNLPAVKQVKLKLVHIDFWSAVKAGFLVTLAMGIATVVGLFVVWLAISSTGVFDSVSQLINGVVGTDSGSGAVDVSQQLSLPKVMTFAFTIALFNIVIGTILTGVSALIFNVIGRITGGISVGFTNN